MELITIPLAAGETRAFERGGNYLEIIEASGALNIELQAADGSQADDMRGALSGFYSEEPYASLMVGNPEAYAQTVKLMISSRRGGSRRQPGNVRVIDQGFDKTISGNQFLQSYTQTATVGQGSVVYLGANGGSGKKVCVRRLALQSGVAGSMLVLVGATGGSFPAPTSPMRSKYIGGASSGSARAGIGAPAAATPTGAEFPGASSWVRVYVPANQIVEVPLSAPIIIDGSNLLIVSGEALNRDVSALFDAEEV